MVGTSGKEGEHAWPDTASAVNMPERTWGSNVGPASKKRMANS